METIYFPTISDEDFSFGDIFVESCFPSAAFGSLTFWLVRKLFFPSCGICTPALLYY
jgi:hypothetical protein